MFECWKEKRICPDCKAKLIVEFENQITGFRDMSYLFCPKCDREIERSMSVDYMRIEVEE